MSDNDDVSSEGKSPTNELRLRRKFGLVRGISIVIGSMIGSGIFISPTGILRNVGGSVGLSLVVWVVCGLIAIATSVCLCELGLSYPESGGVNTYLLRCYGSGIAFLHAWSFCLIVAPGRVAALGLAVGEYVASPFYPSCSPPDVIIQSIGVTTVLIIALVNCVSVRLAARLLVFFTAGKVVVLIILSVSAYVYLGQDSSIADENFNVNNAFDLSQPLHGTVAYVGAAEISLALYQGMWPYSGFSNLNVITEEISKPQKNFPRAATFGVLVVILVYVFVNCAYFSVMTPTEMLQSRSVAITLADRTITSWAWIAPVGVAISVVGTMDSGMLTNGRMAFVAGKRKFLPKILSMIQVDFYTPAPSLILTVVLGIVFIFPANFDSLVQATVYMDWLFIGMSMIGLIFTRWTKKDVKRPLKVPLILPVLVTLLSAYLVITPLVVEPDFFILYATAFTLAGLIFYFPLVYYKLDVPGVDKVTTVLQQFLNVSPPK